MKFNSSSSDKGKMIKCSINKISADSFSVAQTSLISSFCGGKLFVAVKVWYPMKEKVGSEFYMYRKKYADIYDTYALFTVPDC